MKNAILVHGRPGKAEYYDDAYPSASNAHWLPWLTKQLMIRDIPTVAPEMPNAYHPDYAVWKREFERFDVTPDTILVGHSCGTSFLLRWISEANTTVGKVILVAPWMGIPINDKPIDETFFDFTVDNSLTDKTKGITIIHSLDDHPSISESVKILREGMNDVHYLEFADKGHFTYKDLSGEKFPELLEEILR